MENNGPINNVNPNLPQEPLQAPDPNVPTNPPGERPALSAKRHLKFFTVVLLVAIIIVTALYYNDHPLPDFVKSTADTLMNKPNNQKTIFQSATTIQQGQTFVNDNQRIIVESVGRSETTYVTETAGSNQ